MKVLDVLRDRFTGNSGGLLEFRLKLLVFDRGKRSWQISLNKTQRAVEAVDRDLEEDSGRLTNVCAGRIQQARDEILFSDHVTEPRVGGRGLEHRKLQQACRDRVVVDLRIVFIALDLLKLEQASTHVRRKYLEIECI